MWEKLAVMIIMMLELLILKLKQKISLLLSSSPFINILIIIRKNMRVTKNKKFNTYDFIENTSKDICTYI
jgi:hypothetical protein